MKITNLTLDRARELLHYDPLTGQFNWKVQQGKANAGDVTGSIQAGYKKTTIDKEQVKLHRLAWFMTYGKWPDGQIDHINGDKLDNSISNLRDVSMSINMQNRYFNRRKESDLPYGVTRNKTGKFVANIRVGIFQTADDASAAFMRAKRLIHDGCTR